MARIPIGEARELPLSDDEFARLLRHIEGETSPPVHDASRCHCWRDNQGRHQCTTPLACELPELTDAEPEPQTAAGALLWPLGVAVCLLLGWLGWLAWGPK